MNLAQSVNLVQNIKISNTHLLQTGDESSSESVNLVQNIKISNTHLLQTGDESSSVC